MDRDLIAEALPGYEIGQELGRGGWGVVLAAQHRQLGRAVAIKQLPSVFSADESVRSRFLAEARVLASLTHPHIIPIYDYVEHQGVCLLVMEQLTGGTLWTRFTDRGLTLESACAALLAACAGLHHAHQHDVLHRDVKPENLMFSADGVVKVTDFGIAKVLTGGETMATRAGEVLGTPAYMAPEQARGETIGPPADVYAAGIMLYELLSGRLPFSEEGGALSIVYRHVNEDPTPIGEVAPQLPPALADVVMTAIARSPDDRYASAEVFGVALGEAATATWGPGWVDRAEMSVVVGDPILSTTVRPSAPPDTGQAGDAPPAPPRAAETIIDAGPAPPTGGHDAAAPPTGGHDAAAAPTGGQDAGAAPATAGAGAARVRPEAGGHVAGAAAADLDADDLIPVREAVRPPAFPTVHVVAAVALLMITLGVAFAGPAAEPSDEALSPGTLEVAGVDPAASGQLPELDLSQPVPISLGPSHAAAEAVRVQLSVAGIPLSRQRTEPLEPADGGASTTMGLQGSRYVAASTVTAELGVLRGGEAVATYDVGVRASHPAWLTLPGALVVALVLFALAYAESFLRRMRRGRARVTGVIGMLLVGAGGGAAAVGVAWLLGGRQPVVPTTAAVAALGAAAGLAGALAALRLGARRRIRRTQEAP